MSSLGAVLAIATATLIVLLPRHRAMMPILAAVCFLPIGQSLQVAGLNFYLFRLVLFASLVRIVIRGEARDVRWCRLDTLVFCWAAVVVVFGTLGNPGLTPFITLLGALYNGLASYVVCRALVTDRKEFLIQLRFLAIMAVPLAVAMTLEKATGRNIFAILGGVPEFTFVRDGKVRAQGAFKHPILAGTFGATLLPLMVAMAGMRDRSLKWSGVVGTACAAFIAWAAASSGAFLAAAGGVAALCLWPLRRSLRAVRIAAVLLVLVLQAGMNRPVWWIFDSIGGLTGGSGWHRSYIIDAAIRHFREWWLIGTPVTAHWGGYPPPPGDPNNIDLTNQFVVEAVGGGALRLFLFAAIIWLCFRSLGRAFRARGASIQPQTEWLAWCVGVTLLAHCVCFFSVAYFDQMIFYWFWLLSVIAAGTMQGTWLIRDRSTDSIRRSTALKSRVAASPPEEERRTLASLLTRHRER